MAARQAARAEVTVEASPEEAFSRFTEEIGLWWRRVPSRSLKRWPLRRPLYDRIADTTDYTRPAAERRAAPLTG